MRTLVLTVALLVGTTALARPAQSFLLSHEGRLLDANDHPVTGAQALTFQLSPNAAPPVSGADTFLWTGIYSVNLDSQGDYAVMLGDTSNQPGTTTPNPPLTADVLGAMASGPLYLQITVGTTVLSPRMELTPSPLAVSALEANDAQALQGHPASDFALAADTYSKADVDSALALKADAATTYSKTDVDTMLAGYYTKTDVDSALALKADAATTYTKTDADAKFLAQSDAASTYLAKSDAAGTYLAKTDAASTYLAKTDAASTYLAKTDAASTYLTQANAASTYLTQANAASIYATQSALASGLAAQQKPLSSNCAVGQYLRGFTQAGAPLCGMALCPVGKADCNGDASDGCETTLGTDTNCGACADACTGGKVCYAGSCTTPIDSVLINQAQLAQINTWIGSSTAAWTLLYRASRDGATASAFHAHVNGQTGEKFFVTKLSTGVLIGGYTTLTWQSTGNYQNDGDRSSFLFSLTNNFKYVETGAYASQGDSIYDQANWGPTFGGGFDFGTYNNFGSNNGSNYCNLGYAYACRVGSYGSSTCQNDLCGNYSGWYVVDLEVFKR